MNNRFAPPEHLSTRARAIWQSLVPYRARSVGRMLLLEQALRALDLADECRSAIASDGMTKVTKTTGAIHINPLAKLERESRQQFCRCWHELGFQWEQTEDGCNLESWRRKQECAGKAWEDLIS